MAFAAGSRHALAYVAEATFGVTPETPAMQELRHTACSLGLAKDSLESNEIRADRQIAFQRHGNRRVTGEIGVEFAYGAFDTLLEAALFGSWSSDVLKAGMTERSLTIERGFSDIGQYAVHSGSMVSSFSLSVRPNQIVTGSFGILGKEMSLAASPLDASVTAAPANEPFDSFQGTLTEGGGAIAIVTGLDFTLENGLDPAFVIGSASTPRITPGRSRLTGTLSAYFEDETLLAKFVDETPSAIALTLSGAGGSYAIAFENVKYTGGSVPADNAGPLALSLPFIALYDAAEQSQVTITRTAA
ncbi:phage tail tube protein [Oceanibacterium hippocampi]|uniref:Uncharacterized protein n=1 Tax=Oceanibacterium hippocampi TaxID=745714 RepID=A0A1Y5S3C0_9PROT|nr:phage tail tube protein [Oceanibacterium hippocampi]SLN31744.1 hypothetical protein OCH7691_01148 [Oceanibacterium hippocampi]